MVVGLMQRCHDGIFGPKKGGLFPLPKRDVALSSMWLDQYKIQAIWNGGPDTVRWESSSSDLTKGASSMRARETLADGEDTGARTQAARGGASVEEFFFKARTHTHTHIPGPSSLGAKWFCCLLRHPRNKQSILRKNKLVSSYTVSNVVGPQAYPAGPLQWQIWPQVWPSQGHWEGTLFYELERSLCRTSATYTNQIMGYGNLPALAGFSKSWWIKFEMRIKIGSPEQWKRPSFWGWNTSKSYGDFFL